MEENKGNAYLLNKKNNKVDNSIKIEKIIFAIYRIIDQISEDEDLSKKDFEERYSDEIERSKCLGKSGWVVSLFSDLETIEKWYDLLIKGKEDDIVYYFENENHSEINWIFEKLQSYYKDAPEKRYFAKSKYFFIQMDYMSTAMYLVPLIEFRINELMNFPNRVSYKEKYSKKGFENYLKNEYDKINGFPYKKFLFLEMYPSLIEFLNRLFVDGKYKFENNKEPPYINRNWLLHGRTSREIKRFECIQLFNALNVIEHVFSIGKYFIDN